MATAVGGHRLQGDARLALNFFDLCPEGVRGAANAAGSDLLRCSCGRRVRLLHFAGGVRGHPLLRKLNDSVLQMSSTTLLQLASLRASAVEQTQPVIPEQAPASSASARDEL